MNFIQEALTSQTFGNLSQLSRSCLCFIREREDRLQELKNKKTEFQSGMWNVNSILMGGLGNDPEIEGKEISGHFLCNHISICG